MRGREPPRAVDEDADAEPLALTRRDAFDPPRLDRDALLEPPDDAHVGVGRALDGGCVEGAIGQIWHGRRSLAEGTPDDMLGVCPSAVRCGVGGSVAAAEPPGPGSERRPAGDRLDGQVQAETEDEGRRREGNDAADPPQG